MARKNNNGGFLGALTIIALAIVMVVVGGILFSGVGLGFLGFSLFMHQALAWVVWAAAIVLIIVWLFRVFTVN